MIMENHSMNVQSLFKLRVIRRTIKVWTWSYRHCQIDWMAQV